MTYQQNVVYRVQGHLKLEEGRYISTERLLARAIDVFKAQHIQQQLRPRISDMAGVPFVQCDPVRIQLLLVNAWLYTQHHGDPQKPVFFGIQNKTLGYPIPSVKDYIKEVPALCMTVGKSRDLPQPKSLYLGATGSGIWELPNPRKVEDLALLDNQHIIDAHYGSVELIHENGDHTQVYVIPIHLREQRPGMMDLPQMDVGHATLEEKAVHPEEMVLLKILQDETLVDMELAEKVIRYIKKYHSSSKRNTGEPFYLHPIAATDIIINYTKDQATIFATLLHDTVEDTPLTLSEIGVVFGPEVAAIVNKVTNLDGQFYRIKMNTQENVWQLLEEADVRVLQVKLADRLHNMRTIEGLPADRLL